MPRLSACHSFRLLKLVTWTSTTTYAQCLVRRSYSSVATVTRGDDQFPTEEERHCNSDFWQCGVASEFQKYSQLNQSMLADSVAFSELRLAK